MAEMMAARTLSVSIAHPAGEVYRFVSNPANLPRWAPGFARSVERRGDAWVVTTADGPVRVEFAAPNELGVADHRVILESGVEMLNPVRVVPNGSGSELLFTLFRWPGMSDAQFAFDADLVMADLLRLKHLLEGPRPA